MKTIKLTLAITMMITTPLAMANDITNKESDRILHKYQESINKYAEDQGKPIPRIQKYKYGMDMDIAKVISVSQPANTCRVVPNRITFKDSQGDFNTIEYLTVGTGCRNDG